MDVLYVALPSSNSVNARQPRLRHTQTIGELTLHQLRKSEDLQIIVGSFNHVIRFFTYIAGPFRHQPLISLYLPSAVTKSIKLPTGDRGKRGVESVEFGRPIHSVTLFGFPVFILGPFNQGLSQGRSICSLFSPTHHPFSFPITFTRCWGVLSSTPGP